jgi:hypothetical protein
VRAGPTIWSRQRLQMPPKKWQMLTRICKMEATMAGYRIRAIWAAKPLTY